MKRIAHQTFFSEAGFTGKKTAGGRRVSVVIQVMITAILFFSLGCSRHLVPSLGEQTTPVSVATAAETNVPVQLQATGYVMAPAAATVVSWVDGVLEKVCFQEGDEVKKGELLFLIDPRQFDAALDQGMANLERDKALKQWAEIKERWNTKLSHQGIISCNACYPGWVNTDSLAATVEADEAAVANARLQRACCDICSPINGRTGMVKINACDWVKRQDPVLVTINQTKPIYVNFSVPEQQLPQIRNCLAATGKLPVTASVFRGEQNPSTGELTLTQFLAGTDAGTAFLRASFPNADEMLLPGEKVHVLLTLTTLTNAVIIPSRSVRNGAHGQYVFIVKPDSTVEARSIQIGYQAGPETVLDKGVQLGEQVVTDGEIALTPGLKVRIQNVNGQF
jgi:membrane fusion protein, multidrug efflux system